MHVRRKVGVFWFAAAVFFIGVMNASGAGHKVHTVFLGALKRVSYGKVGDPAGAATGESELKIRASSWMAW